MSKGDRQNGAGRSACDRPGFPFRGEPTQLRSESRDQLGLQLLKPIQQGPGKHFLPSLPSPSEIILIPQSFAQMTSLLKRRT